MARRTYVHSTCRELFFAAHLCVRLLYPKSLKKGKRQHHRNPSSERHVIDVAPRENVSNRAEERNRVGYVGSQYLVVEL